MISMNTGTMLLLLVEENEYKKYQPTIPYRTRLYYHTLVANMVFAGYGSAPSYVQRRHTKLRLLARRVLSVGKQTQER